MTLRINRARQTVPILARLSHPIDASLVVQGELVPQRPAGLHSIIPRHVMKPQQVLFRAGLQITKTIAHNRLILTYRVASCGCPVKTDTTIIGTVVVNGVPIVSWFGVPPRSRTIMMFAPHDVVKPKRRHVVNQSFVRLEHDSLYGLRSIRIAS